MSPTSPSPPPSAERLQAEIAPPERGSQPTGFGSLARKMARRTTDLLAISLVLVAGLGLGRQAIDWWRADPGAAAGPDVAPMASIRWGDGDVPLQLEFGDAPHAVERLGLRGTRQTAADRLADLCAARMESQDVLPGPASAAEERLLEATARLQPIRQQPGRWEIHAIDGPVLLVAGITSAGGEISAGNEHATASRRVLCWGLAFPSDEEQWTLYLLRPIGNGSGSRHDDGITACLPPGSRRVLAAVDGYGGSMIVFEGEGPIADWQQSIEACLRRAGFRPQERAQEAAAGWTARFESAGPVDQRTVDVHIFRSTLGPLTGIITTTGHGPPATDHP